MRRRKFVGDTLPSGECGLGSSPLLLKVLLPLKPYGPWVPVPDLGRRALLDPRQQQGSRQGVRRAPLPPTRTLEAVVPPRLSAKDRAAPHHSVAGNERARRDAAVAGVLPSPQMPA